MIAMVQELTKPEFPNSLRLQKFEKKTAWTELAKTSSAAHCAKKY
jgi:hypothetical protein